MKIRIKKIETRKDVKYPNSLPSDYERIKTISSDQFAEPVIGSCFYAGGFRSSIVTEIINEKTFKTENSVYEWNIIEENV